MSFTNTATAIADYFESLFGDSFMNKVSFLLLSFLLMSGSNAQAQSGDIFSISPATGTYLTSQTIDLSLLLQKSGVTIQDMTALINNSNVTVDFNQCRVQGAISGGGISYRCPRIGLNILSPGLYTFTVFLQLSDNTTVSDSVQWTVLQNTE